MTRVVTIKTGPHSYAQGELVVDTQTMEPAERQSEMTDTIYSNEKPLDLMDPALRKELEAYEKAGGKIEVYSSVVGWNSVAPVWCRSSFGGCVYRAVREPVVMTVWQNVYPRQIGVTFGGGYSSRDAADKQRRTDRIAVLRTETIDGVSKVYLEDV